MWPPALQTPHQAARQADVLALWQHCAELEEAAAHHRRPRWPPATEDDDAESGPHRWPLALRVVLARAPWAEDASGARLGWPLVAVMAACCHDLTLAIAAVAATAPREATPACAAVSSLRLKRWLAGDRTHPQTLQTPRPCPGENARLVSLDGLWLHEATHAELDRPPPPGAGSAPGEALAQLLAGPWAAVAGFCFSWGGSWLSRPSSCPHSAAPRPPHTHLVSF